MNIKSYFNKSLAITIVALFSFGLLASVASAAITAITDVIPNGGVAKKGDVVITWNAIHDSSTDKVNIYYSTNNFGIETKLTTSDVLVSDGTFTWDTLAAGISDSTNYKVKVASADSLVNGASVSVFTIDNTNPVLNIVDGTETGPVMSDTINLTTADVTSGVASQEYGFSIDNICDSSDTYGNSFTSGTDFTVAGDNTNYLCAKAIDNAGNVGYITVGQLNTDNTAPTVLSYTLDGSAADTYFNPTAPDTAAISITADEPVTWTTLRVQDVATGLIQKDTHPSGVNTTLNTTWDGSVSTGGPLVDGTYALYYTITDVAGNVTGPIAGPLTPYQINVDTVVPTMTSVVATTVQGGGDTIVVTFSEDVVAADGDWTDGNELGFVSPIGTPVDTSNANFSFNSSTNVLTVTLDEATDMSWLKNGLLLRAFTTASKIEDFAGNQMSASKDDPSIDGDTTLPTVGLTYDIDRQVKDADTIVITATFSEEMDNTPQITIATLGDGSLTATNMAMGSDRKHWTYSWDVPAGADDDGTATITITGEDLAGNIMTDSSNTRTIDNTDPLLGSFTNPAAETVYRTNSILTFSASDNSGTEVCSYSLDAGTTYTPLASCTETNTVVAGLAEGRNVIELKIEDEAGNTILSGNPSFVYDTDGVLTVDDTPSTNPDFSTIQGAIDAWVTGITTIQVADGNYPENITVDQILSIIGPNEGIDPNSTISRVGEATISSSGIGNVVTIASGGVTIKGFIITNGGINGGGIYSADYSNLTIQNNIITNIGNTSSDVVGRGITVVSSSSAVDNITIINNKIDDITSGLRTGTASKSASGISIGWSNGSLNITDLLIQNNVISNIDADTSDWTSTTKGQGAYGILLNHGKAGGNTPGAQIMDNTISDLEGLWAHGIGLEGDTPNATVTGNTINNLTDHKGNTDAFGVFFQDNPSASSVTVDSNKFNGLKAEFGGVGIHEDDLPGGSNGYSYTVTAENNWWGDATGPYDGPSAGNKNPNGLGTHVTTNVDYSPFYNSAGMSTLVSVDPIDYFDLGFNPISAMVGPTGSTLTITAKDTLGYTVVNNTDDVSLSVISGTATLGDSTIPMEVDGDITTAITSTVSGTATIRAEEMNIDGEWVSDDGSITFTNSDIVGPEITSQSPADGTGTVSISAVPYLQFNEPLKSSTVNSTNIQLRRYSDNSQVTAVVALVEGDTKVTITPSSPLDYNTQYYLYTLPAVTDTTGNALQTDYDESEKASHEFTTATDSGDYTEPTITLVNPVDSDIDVPVNSNVTVTFSEALDATTVDASSIQLLDASNAVVPATLLMSDGNTKVVIMPNSDFDYNAVYHVDITGAVTDVAGNPFDPTPSDPETITTFTTETAPIVDITAPVVVPPTNPTTGSAGVAITIRPTITFDDVLDATTVSSSAVTLVKNSDSSIVPAVVALVEGGKTIEITPNSNLENGVIYHVEVSSNVKNEAGLAFAGSTNVTTFTTETITPFTVDRIEAISSAATADDTYINGWHYVYYLTVNSGKPNMRVQFDDWVNADGSSPDIAANGNMRALFNTVTGGGVGSVIGLTDTNITDGFGNVASFEIGNTLSGQTPGPMVITPSMDTNLALPGVQVQFDVFTKIPNGAAAGVYTAGTSIEIEN